MTTQRTYYDNLKAKVRYDPIYGWWEWTVYASDDSIIAQGEEHSLKVAHQEATIVAGAIRIWGSVARGVIIPATDARRWFTFQPVPVPMLNLTSKDMVTLNKLTKKKKKGKV